MKRCAPPAVRISRRDFGWRALAAVAAVSLGPRQARATDEGMGESLALPGVLPFEYHPRADWAWSEPRSWLMRAAAGYDRITVHHGGKRLSAPDDEEQIRYELDAVLTGHMNRRYGDVAYHFIIDPAGRVWEGRSLTFEGAHVSAHNAGNIGVMLLGNFEEDQPADRQVRAMRDLLRHLRRRHGIAETAVFGHRDLGATACPGTHLYGVIRNLRRSGGGATLAT